MEVNLTDIKYGTKLILKDHILVSRKKAMFFKPCQLQLGYISGYNSLTNKQIDMDKKVYEMLLKYLGIPQCGKSIVNLGYFSFNDILKVNTTFKCKHVYLHILTFFI